MFVGVSHKLFSIESQAFISSFPCVPKKGLVLKNGQTKIKTWCSWDSSDEITVYMVHGALL